MAEYCSAVHSWVDFENLDVAETLHRLNAHPKFVGVRPMIQDIEDPDWMLKDALAPAFEAIISEGLVFDALTMPHHLKNLHRLLVKYSEMKCVIDHASKPHIKDRAIDEWAFDMKAIARDTNAYCKFSGMVTEAGPNWSVDDLRPYAQQLLNTFGPSRLIWGSDWPVCNLALNYQKWVDTSDALLAELSQSERTNIYGQNAIQVYGFLANENDVGTAAK